MMMRSGGTRRPELPPAELTDMQRQCQENTLDTSMEQS
jgi:hypothetical protein